MAFLRTVIRCSLYKKYGPVFNYLNDSFSSINVKQIALKSTTSPTTTTTIANGNNNNNKAPAASTNNYTTTATASPKDPLDVTFEDAKAAFKSKTTHELLRAYLVYTLCSIETLVENNMKVRVFLLLKSLKSAKETPKKRRKMIFFG